MSQSQSLAFGGAVISEGDLLRDPEGEAWKVADVDGHDVRIIHMTRRKCPHNGWEFRPAHMTRGSGWGRDGDSRVVHWPDEGGEFRVLEDRESANCMGIGRINRD